jgi:quercetin dioxygenase-like cupin family protein
MGSTATIPSKFVVNKARDNPFRREGLRAYREYRDLGVAGATGGAVHAQIVRTTTPCPPGGSGMHYHDLDFQMVFCLKGRSRVWFEGQGEVEFEAGDSWIQPPRIRHNVLYYSEDYEVLEITMPAVYETVPVKEDGSPR